MVTLACMNRALAVCIARMRRVVRRQQRLRLGNELENVCEVQCEVVRFRAEAYERNDIPPYCRVAPSPAHFIVLILLLLNDCSTRRSSYKIVRPELRGQAGTAVETAIGETAGGGMP